MPGIYPTIAVEVELSGHGSGWTAITTDVLKSTGIVMRHGIQSSSPADRVATTGMASFFMDNTTGNSGFTVGYYSPNHASVRAGWALGIWCRIRITDPATSTVYTRFIGRVDSIDPAPGIRRERTVAVTVVDWLDEAARWKLTPAIGEQVGQDWSAVVTDIIAQMPVAPVAQTLNSGSENYPYSTDTSQISRLTAMGEFLKLANSEYGLVYVKADGTLRLEDRHQRMLTAVSAWTLTQANFQDLDLPSSRDDIINTVRVNTHPKVVSALPNVTVYDQANVIRFEAGETKMLLGSYRDQATGDPIGATDIQPLVIDVDYSANTAEDGSGTNVVANILITTTIGSSGVRFDITNTFGGVAYLTSLRLVGKGIYDYGETTHEATDAASISSHGEHAIDFDMPYQARDDVGQGAANYILEKSKDPLAQARLIRVAGRDATRLTQILIRDISDRITISEAVTGVNDAFFINGVELHVLPTGTMEALYTLAPTNDPAVNNFFVIDSSSLNGPDVLAPF